MLLKCGLWGSPGGWFREQMPRPSCSHLSQVRLTIHVTGHLAEHGQVGLVDDRTEYPPPALLVLPEDPLPGHAEGHHPHRKEEQEEEHVDELSGRTGERSQDCAHSRQVPPAWPSSVGHGEEQRFQGSEHLSHPEFTD